MTNEEKRVKCQSLKSKLVALPIKVVITIALFIWISPYNNMEVMVWYEKLLTFGVIYNGLSLLHYFATVMGNWILGIVVAVIAVFVIEYLRGLENVYISCVAAVFELFMLIGFFVLDVTRIIRYIMLSTSLRRD